MLKEISAILSFLNPKNWSLKNWAILMLGSGLLGSLPYFLKTPAVDGLQSGPIYLVIVAVACLSLAGFVVTGIEKYHAFWKRSKALAEAEARRKKYLYTLTVEEKQLLCGYILHGTKTKILQPDDGVVSGLVNAGIIHLASDSGTVSGFAYNIHESAWLFLTKNQQLITEGVPTKENGEILAYRNTGSPLGLHLNRLRR